MPRLTVHPLHNLALNYHKLVACKLHKPSNTITVWVAFQRFHLTIILFVHVVTLMRELWKYSAYIVRNANKLGEPENIDHFLCRCSYPPIKDSRERFLPRLIQLLHTALGFERLDEQSEYNEIVQLVLDCTAYDPDESHTHDTAWLVLESHAREYCYELHRLRYAAVKELRGSQPCRSRPLRTA